MRIDLKTERWSAMRPTSLFFVAGVEPLRLGDRLSVGCAIRHNRSHKNGACQLNHHVIFNPNTSAPQVCTAQIRTAQICADQVSLAQIRAPQIRLKQIRSKQIGLI